MSISLDEPIYKTEVVRVSDMPKAKYLDSESLLLVAQGGKSKQLSYDVLESSICDAAESGISSRLNNIDEKIKKNAKAISQLSSKEASDISYLSAVFEKSQNRAIQALSSDVTRDFIARDKVLQDQQALLKKFVDDQDLPSFNTKIVAANVRIDSVEAQVQTLSTKEASDIVTLSTSFITDLKAAENRIYDTTSQEIQKKTDALDLKLTKDMTARENALKAKDSYLEDLIESEITKTQKSCELSCYKLTQSVEQLSTKTADSIRSLSRQHAADIKQLSTETVARVESLSTELKSDIRILEAQQSDSMRAISADIKAEIKSLSSTSDFNERSLSLSLSTLSEFTARSISAADIQLSSLQSTTEMLSTKLDTTSQSLDELDTKLYGFVVNERNSDGTVTTTVLQAGDIPYLSDEISSIASSQEAVTSGMVELSSSIEQKFTVQTVSGLYEIKPSQTYYIGVNVAKEGYSPFAITAVEIRNEHNVVSDEAIPLNRFICSDEEARLEVKSTLESKKTYTVISKVMYIKSM